MKRRPNSYWDKRSQQRMAEYHRSADSTIQTITQAYDRGAEDIAAEIEKIFKKFAKDGKLSPDEARKLLNEPISRAEWNAVKAKMNAIKDPKIKRQLLNRLNAPAYAARITRLQALKENAYLQSKIIADAEIRASTAGYMGTINHAYYRTMFDIQRGLGVGFEFARIPKRVIETILKRPWSGKHYSSRIWGNTDALASQLNEVLTGGFMSGLSLNKMVQQLQERADVGKFAANRLLRTETTYMANAAEMESYEEADIDRYQFIAILDKKTSPECRAHDLKVFKVKDAVPGKNMPPLHAFCRSTTRAYFGASTLNNIERRAQDPSTGKTYLIPANMNYSEWEKKYVLFQNDGPGETPGAYAQVSSVREAEEFARKHLGFSKVDYTGMDVQSVNALNKSMFDVMSKYPKIKGFAESIIAVDTEDFVALASLKVDGDKLISGLKVSKRYYNSREIDDIIKLSVGSQHWPAGSNQESIFTHEFGHLLEYAHAVKSAGSWTGQPVDNDLIQVIFSRLQLGKLSKEIKLKALTNLGLPNTTETIKKELSQYGATKPQEFLAESFAEAEGTKNPRRVAKEAIRLLKEKLEEVGLL